MLKDSSAEKAEEGGRALSLLSPVTLSDVFLEQQREIRNAEDRVMQLQCFYNEESVRMKKDAEEHGALKAEIERNNQRLIAVTEETLQLQRQFQDLCKEIDCYNAESDMNTIEAVDRELAETMKTNALLQRSLDLGKADEIEA